MPNYEYKKLRLLMYERSVTALQAAKACGITQPTLSLKLQGESSFTLDEVYALCVLLEIAVCDIPIFFPNRKKNTKGANLK